MAFELIETKWFSLLNLIPNDEIDLAFSVVHPKAVELLEAAEKKASGVRRNVQWQIYPWVCQIFYLNYQ